MNQLVARLAGDVAADEFAVHADTLARYLQHADLLIGYLLEAFLHQVDTCPLLILTDSATEQIIGV